MNTQNGIVFIHGAGLGSWIWDEAKRFTPHVCLAVDFPCRQLKNGETNHDSLDEYSEHIIRQVSDWGHNPFVIVAHSIGGVVAMKLAAYFGKRVSGFVAVGACIPSGKGSFLSSLPFFQRSVTSIIMRLAGTRPPDSAILSSYCRDLDAVTAEKVLSRFVPESRHLYTDECHANVPRVKSMYIRLTDDKSFSPSLQNRMIGNMNDAEVTEIKSGHLPMLSKPEEFANLLNSFVMACEVELV